jgi:hypothetical protein
VTACADAFPEITIELVDHHSKIGPYRGGRVSSWVCDNYLIGPSGPGERLHRFPEAITELG